MIKKKSVFNAPTLATPTSDKEISLKLGSIAEKWKGLRDTLAGRSLCKGSLCFVGAIEAPFTLAWLVGYSKIMGWCRMSDLN